MAKRMGLMAAAAVVLGADGKPDIRTAGVVFTNHKDSYWKRCKKSASVAPAGAARYGKLAATQDSNTQQCFVF